MESQPRAAAGADLVIPLLAGGFTIYFLYSVSALEWEAKANGVIIGTILLVLIAVQVMRSILAVVRGRADVGFGPLLSPPDAIPKRLGMLAVTIVFVASLPWLGLAIGLFAALIAGMLVMGVRGWKRVLLVAFAVSLAATLLFTVALDAGLPKGPVEKLINRVQG
jgi:hypothetical protein